MGLISWFKGWKARQKLEEMRPDEISLYIDAYLKRTQEEHASTLKQAQKLNKAALMEQQTKSLKSNIKTLLEDEEDEEDSDEEDEEEEDFGDKLFKDLVSQFVKSKTNQTPAAASVPSSMSDKISQVVSNLTPEQKILIKKQFGIDL